MKFFRNIARTDLILWLFIVIVCAFHLQKHLKDLIFTDFPPALDPYLFASQSLALTKGESIFALSYSVFPSGFFYPPILTILGGLIKIMTGGEILTIYTWLGPLLGAMLIPVTYLSFRCAFGKIPALITALAIGFSSIILNRTLLTLPENIGFFFLIIFLGLFLQKEVRNFWQLVLTIFLVGALTHYTIIYIPLILGAHFLINPKKIISKITKKHLIALVTIFAAILILPFSPLSSYFYTLVSTLVKFINTSNFGFSLGVTQILHFLSNIFIILGLFGGLLALENWRETLAQKLVIAGTILISGAVIFQSQNLTFGAITADRFYPFVAISFALFCGYLAITLGKIFSWFPTAMLVFLIILIPFYSYRGWDYTFTKDEFEAAKWLKNTPEDSIIVASPLMNWLIPPASERSVIRQRFPEALINLKPKDIKAKITTQTKNPLSQIYIFVSKNKLGECFVGLKTDGYFTQCHDEKFLPKINLVNFADLPLVYENETVFIYRL